MASKHAGLDLTKVEGMARRAIDSSFTSEVAILALLLACGLSGILTGSVSVTATMFLGGFITWLCFMLPSFLQSRQQCNICGNIYKTAGVTGVTVTISKDDEAVAALPAPDAVMALIKRRRSVYPKDYNGQTVPREQLEKLLEAANWAPTHGQTEPWRFVVLEGASKLEMENLTMELCRTRLPEEKIEKTIEKLQKKRDSTWGKISCYIAICCKRQVNPEKLMPEWEEMAAVACSVQNMALIATSMGLATYWTSWQEVAREAPEMKVLLGLVPEDRVMGFFTVGSIERERLEGYRAGRGPWADKVTWRS